MFMFYLCIRLRICVFYVGRKIRPYFVQITQNKALFWNARKKKINRNINKTQTRTQTFVHVCGLCFFMLGKKNIFWANKTLFCLLRKRNVSRNIKQTASSRNFWICREYAFCLRIGSRLCMRMCRPVQDGLYSENLGNPAKLCHVVALCHPGRLNNVETIASSL